MNVGTGPGFGPCRTSASSVEPRLYPFFHLVPGVLSVARRSPLVGWLE
jgi:hypothetical protein